jgi:hypothetical protein
VWRIKVLGRDKELYKVKEIPPANDNEFVSVSVDVVGDVDSIVHRMLMESTKHV